MKHPVHIWGQLALVGDIPLPLSSQGKIEEPALSVAPQTPCSDPFLNREAPAPSCSSLTCHSKDGRRRQGAEEPVAVVSPSRTFHPGAHKCCPLERGGRREAIKD